MTSANASLNLLGSGTRSRSVRALITIPAEGRRGGVSQYFCAVRPHLKSRVRYFSVGSRSDHESIGVSLRRMFADSLRFAKILRKKPFDIVHLNPSIGAKALVRDGILLAIAKWSSRVAVVFFHGLDDHSKGFSAFLLGRFVRLMYGRADAFVVLSTEVKSKLIGWGCNRPIFLYRAPVDDDLVSCCQHGSVIPNDNRAQASQAFNILFLARIERSKGIYEAIEAYQLLRRDFPFVTLTVAGDGSELPAVRDYVAAARIPDIVFTGFVEGGSKITVLRIANAYLFPSYYEGLPLSVLEAMACGLPVVASAVGGLRDFFMDGHMGFLADDHDPATLARLLAELVRNPDLCSTIRQFNHAYAADHFAAQRVAGEIDTLYRHVLGCSD